MLEGGSTPAGEAVGEEVEAPAPQAEPEGRIAALRARLAAGPDAWLARALLLAALLFAGAQDWDHALHGGLYGPLDEFFHTAYVQKVADTGTPPTYGRDGLRLGPTDTPAPAGNVTVIRGVDTVPGQPNLFPAGTLQGQNEAIQPPLYYYVVAPIAKVVPWSHRVVAIRLASSLMALAAVVFLFLALRVTWPSNPLAAGVGAVALATMTGLNSTMSQVQNSALMLGLSGLVLYLLIRDVQRRDVGWALPLAAGLLPVTQVVSAAGAALAVLVACGVVLWDRRPPRRDAVRFALPRLALFAAPVLAWVAWNLATYHHLTPVDLSVGPGQAPVRTYTLFRLSFELIPRALWSGYNGFYTTFWPLPGGVGIALGGVLPAALALGLVVAAFAGGLRSGRWPLGWWLACTLAAWLGSYGMLILSAVTTAGPADFVGRYFSSAAVAFAGVVGIGVAAAYDRFPWVVRAGSVAASLIMLVLATQSVFPGFLP